MKKRFNKSNSMIKILKTFEIDDILWEQIAAGFNESFDRNVTVESLKNGFCVSNQRGYAFHAIAINDETGDIMAFNTYTPTFYKNGLNAMVSGSTFVKQKYRKDIFIFYDMVLALRERAKEEGFAVEIGVPNENSKEYGKVLLKDRYVADLDYYILPRNISKVLGKPALRYLDCLSRFMCTLYLSMQYLLSLVCNYKEKEPKFALITDEEFYCARFKSSAYIKYKNHKYTAYYKVEDEDGKKVAYLFDFKHENIRTRKALTKAVWHIYHHEKPDAILFVGFLWLRQFTLLPVPNKFVPKPLPLTYYVLDKKRKEEFKDMDEKNNWNFSLMNFDVR